MCIILPYSLAERCKGLRFSGFICSFYIICFLASLDKSRKLVSIKGTAEKHRASISWLPVMYASSGCNTVSKMCGIGKFTVLKTITQNFLGFFGNLESTASDVVQEAK